MEFKLTSAGGLGRALGLDIAFQNRLHITQRTDYMITEPLGVGGVRGNFARHM